MNRTIHVEVSSVGILVFVVCVAAGGALGILLGHPAPFAAASVLLGVYLMFAIKVVRQWEKVAVLRFGRFVKLQGPGVFTIIPIVETPSAITWTSACASPRLQPNPR